MQELYGPAELRLVQETSNVSAADALYVNVGYPGVPQGKVWTVIGFSYMPSAAETRTCSIEKYTRATNRMTVLNPVSVALNPQRLSCIEQGMTILLLPGEYFTVRRDVATAGSTMGAWFQFIETDLPLYDYVEPQEQLRLQKFRRALVPNPVASSGVAATRVGGGGFVGEKGSVPRPK